MPVNPAAKTTVDRTQIIAGPAMVTTTLPGGGAGTTFVFEDSLTIKYTTTSVEIKVNGIVRNKLVTGKNIVISGKPVGMFRDLGVIFPYGTLLPGSFIFGADAPCLVQPYDTTQPQITFATGAITKMPDLNFTAGGSLFDGDLEITCLGKNATLSNDAAYRYVEAANAFAGDTYDPTKYIVQPYDISHPLLNAGNTFDTEAGVKVAWNLTLTDRPSDSIGTYNKQFTAMNPTATFIPLGVPVDDVRAALGLQGANSVRGSLASTLSGDLVISGAGVYFKLPGANFSEGSDVFGTTVQRVGQLTATGIGANGTPAHPFFVLSTQAP